MSTVLVTQKGPVARVELNRPEIRNAFNDQMITDLGDAMRVLEKDDKVRVVILSGKGDFFCAGADLNWMRSFVSASQEANEADARRLADLMTLMNQFPKPLVTQVKGAAIGGGLGLVAVSDIVIADHESIFALAEVKLGLVPAVISPFVMAKMGISGARRHFLTGARFDTSEAVRWGLVHEEVEAEDMEARTLDIVKELLTSAPLAIGVCKQLIQRVGGFTPEVTEYTVKKIAELRVGEEGQEGIKAFLEKRKPGWNL